MEDQEFKDTVKDLAQQEQSKHKSKRGRIILFIVAVLFVLIIGWIGVTTFVLKKDMNEKLGIPSAKEVRQENEENSNQTNTSNGTQNSNNQEEVVVIGEDGIEIEGEPGLPDPCSSSTATPEITLASPNGGETYFIGGDMRATWRACNISGSITITAKEVGSENSPVILAANTPNDSIEVLSVPDSFLAGQYILTVSSNSIEDFSDEPFTISEGEVPSLTVTSPNGGETFSQGSATVTWNSTNIPESSNVSIVLMRINQEGSTTVYYLSPGTPNDGQQVVTLPASAGTGDNFKVSISSDYYGNLNSFFDESNNTFSIQ